MDIQIIVERNLQSQPLLFTHHHFQHFVFNSNTTRYPWITIIQRDDMLKLPEMQKFLSVVLPRSILVAYSYGPNKCRTTIDFHGREISGDERFMRIFLSQQLNDM